MSAPETVSRDELESLVALYFCRGCKPTEIPRQLKEQRGIDVSPKRIYKLLSGAAQRQRLRYVADPETTLRDKITALYPSHHLDRLEVVSTLALQDLAYCTAEMLRSILSTHHKSKPEVHIGFAGGGTLLEVARALSEILRDPDKTVDVPRRLVFHSVVAGWNVDEPEKDPNSFSVVLYGEHLLALDFEIRFVALHAPGILRSEQYDSLRDLVGIKEAYEAVNQIDVFVTSAGRWECHHSALYRLYTKYSEATLTKLREAGCVGDLMWCPLGPDGQIDLSDIDAPQAITLMPIRQLHDLICKKGKHVLLALGPCSVCREPKTAIARTVLGLAPSQRFATHLVCDSRTASRLLRPE